MKRHVALHPLSQHHHFALIQVWEMRRAVEAPAAKRAAALRAAAGKFVRFWKRAGAQHFREEEEVLVPAYGRHTRLDQDARVARLLREHAQIRDQVARLEAVLAVPSADDATLGEVVPALAQSLHDHVRFEENELFPKIEQTLSEQELTELAPHLTRLHKKNHCDPR